MGITLVWMTCDSPPANIAWLFLYYTCPKSNTRQSSRVWLIFVMDWISFHSLATKYVLQILTGAVAVVGVAWLAPTGWLEVKSTPLGLSQSMKNTSTVHWCHRRYKMCNSWKNWTIKKMHVIIFKKCLLWTVKPLQVRFWKPVHPYQLVEQRKRLSVPERQVYDGQVIDITDEKCKAACAAAKV